MSNRSQRRALKQARQKGQIANSDVPPSNGARQSLTVMQQQSLYQGPIPPAEQMERYEQILKGSADRILAMAEKQQAHRHGLEVFANKAVRREGLIGQVFAFLIAGSALFCGYQLVMHDKPVAGVVSLITAVGVVVAAFLNRSPKKKE